MATVFSPDFVDALLFGGHEKTAGLPRYLKNLVNRGSGHFAADISGSFAHNPAVNQRVNAAVSGRRAATTLANARNSGVDDFYGKQLANFKRDRADGELARAASRNRTGWADNSQGKLQGPYAFPRDPRTPANLTQQVASYGNSWQKGPATDLAKMKLRSSAPRRNMALASERPNSQLDPKDIRLFADISHRNRM